MAVAPHARKPGLFAYILVAAIAAAAGFAAIYVTSGDTDNAARRLAAPASGEKQAPAAPPPGPGSNALSRGEMTAFVFKKTPELLPEVSFEDASGAARTLADWKGKAVLLNLWATWCAPCRKEMPALDRLQKEMGGETFEVVALAVDRAGAAAAKKFLEETGVVNLTLYADPTARSGAALKAVGMPTTFLIDREGREIGRLVGPAEWDSADAKRLISEALDQAH